MHTQELLHAARVMLPHLVRLLPACAAAASQASETLEFITKHTHHPHYQPFSSSSAGGAGTGRAKSEAAALEAGGASSAADQVVLLQVPQVVVQLMGERCALGWA